MGESFQQVMSHDGDGLYVQATGEKEGWSSQEPVVGLSSSVSSRTRRLRSLHSPTETKPKDMESRKDVKLGPPASISDLGLDCTGPLSDVVDADRGELTSSRLPLTDSHQIEKVCALFNEKKILRDHEWIDFQSKRFPGEFPDCRTDIRDKGERPVPENDIHRGQDILGELDDLEAARPKRSERNFTIPGNRDGIWEQPKIFAVTQEQEFPDWIDEVAALEASVSMPEGTRYYKVNDPEEPNS
ncbi:hypothetical protein GGR50DRAFT_698850 [Xylaria sp. CBS 124048]|nr:hypothetical protein GGR50DRAFT_698850 [Xylaria sp. CBS 124048]